MKKILAILMVLTLAVGLCGVASADIFRDPLKNPYSDELKIGYIPTDAPTPACIAWEVGIRNETAAWPNVTVNTFDGERDAEHQSTVIFDLINQGYDAIILQPYNSATVAVAVEEAEMAGIPVVCLNIDADIPHAAVVQTTDYESGYTAAINMAEAVGGEGNFVVIQATPGANRGENIEAGFQAGIAEYPGITILDEQSGEWSTEKANTVMSDFLTNYSEIDGVFCHNDAMAEGAATAIQVAGKTGDIQVWGVNGESKAIEYIEQGLMTGTIYADMYAQGATAARLAMMFIGGTLNTAEVESTFVIKMSPVVVTAETAAEITPEMRW